MNPENIQSPKVLLVTGVPFWRTQRGSSQRVSAMYEYLASFSDVTVAYLGEMSIEQWNQAEATLGCAKGKRNEASRQTGQKPNRRELIGPGMPGRLASVMVSQFSKLLNRTSENSATIEGQASEATPPSRLADFHSDLIADYVCQHVEQEQPDVVIFEYVILSYLACSLRKSFEPGQMNPLLLIDTHDVMHVRCETFSQLGHQHWLQIDAQEEAAALSNADVVLAIQEDEAASLKQMLPDQQVCVVKHAWPIDQTANYDGEHRKPDVQQTSQREFSIGFVGSAGDANLLCLESFLRHVWPTVQASNSDNIKLIIGGSISKSDVSRSLELNNVVFAGRFENSATFYSQLDLAINPAVIPSGLKIKSLEALSFSVPLLATPAGLAGMEAAIDRCALCANDWDEFASSIIDLAADRERVGKLAQAAGPFIAESFSPDAVYANLKTLVENHAATMRHRLGADSHSASQFGTDPQTGSDSQTGLGSP